MSKRIIILILILFVPFILFVLLIDGDPVKEPKKPVNANLSQEATDVLNYLYEIRGNHVLSGQHNSPLQPTYSTDYVYDTVGKFPAIWGSDMGVSAYPDRQAVVDMAIQAWHAGSIVTFSFHACNPNEPEPCTFNHSVKSSLTDEEWNDITVPGTAMYNKFIDRIDSIAPYLEKLRDAHVPVLWRPFHEMNAGWSWWGGHSKSKELYRIMYDRYTQEYDLNNLIWVWNVQKGSLKFGPIADYNPGDDYFDVLAMDFYGKYYVRFFYTEIRKAAKGKPIALGEVGILPKSRVFTFQPDWVYFYSWKDWIQRNNTVKEVQKLYNASKILTQDELPSFGQDQKEDPQG